MKIMQYLSGFSMTFQSKDSGIKNGKQGIKF